MNVTMNDEGFYSCTASGAMGNQPQVTQEQFDFCSKSLKSLVHVVPARSSCNHELMIIFVLAVPLITSVDVTPNPQAGEPFFIECIADGIPVPGTAWVKDGAPLNEKLSV